MDELFVGVHDSELVLGRKRTIALSPVPDFIRNEEVEAFNFTSIRIFRNAEETISRLIVRNVFGIFVGTGSPRFGIFAGINRVFRVLKSFIESLNLAKVVSDTSSKN